MPGSDLGYHRAMRAASERFAPLAAALTARLGLDTEPSVDQTGGMIFCLSITWPDGAYALFSDYWWFRSELQLYLYQAEDDEVGARIEAPTALLDILTDDVEPQLAGTPEQAKAIAEWAAPWIAMHGAAHGWERRF